MKAAGGSETLLDVRGVLEEIVQMLRQGAAGGIDLSGERDIVEIPDRRALGASPEPGVALVKRSAEIHQRPGVILFHVEQIPVEKQPPGSGLPFDELLGVFGHHPDVKPVSQVVESGHPFAVLRESSLSPVLR
jgi:hypothetical protein